MTALSVRTAVPSDVPHLVAMLADDELGAQRESAGPVLDERYTAAFAAIDTDPNNELIVAEREGRLVGVLQLTFIPYLTHTGSWRCLVEGVRVAADARGAGLGRQLLEFAIDRARARDCRIVQLTSDKRRTEAIRFYESLGFVASHEGFKLGL